MQASVRNSEWDEVKVRYGDESIRFIYRRGPGTTHFEPWVVIAPSALMMRVGRLGLGLYAGRSFKKGDHIGMYDGKEVGQYNSREEAITAPETRRLLMRGHDKIICVRAKGKGYSLIDGEEGGAPHVHFCNDPRGTSLKANAEITDGGWLRVLQTRVPAFKLDSTLEENIKSEFRIDYGEEYWDLQEVLGTDEEYAIRLD